LSLHLSADGVQDARVAVDFTLNDALSARDQGRVALVLGQIEDPVQTGHAVGVRGKLSVSLGSVERWTPSRLQLRARSDSPLLTPRVPGSEISTLGLTASVLVLLIAPQASPNLVLALAVGNHGIPVVVSALARRERAITRRRLVRRTLVGTERPRLSTGRHSEPDGTSNRHQRDCPCCHLHSLHLQMLKIP
jgi:hypothetical protein